MAYSFLMPPAIISGENALIQASDKIALMGKKALVVTDPMMKQLKNLDKVTQALKQQKMAYSVYADITGEPTDGMIMAGVRQYKEENCDFLIAIGGGSAIDAMKAIAMLSACGGKPIDYMGKTVTQPLPNMTAIPTTAGTGSEATQFTIISDVATQVKMLLKGPSLMPNLAVIDPQFTMTAPPKITAATGMDALTHAIEAYTSRKAQPMSDTFALSAVKRIFASLKTAYDCPQDEQARTQMAIAALEAGVAFNNSSVTIVHGMSRPIGALFHVAHGLSNAMLLEDCLRYVACGALDRFADIARYCGMADLQTEDSAATEKLLFNVAQLLKDLNIPTLKEYGIDKTAYFENISKMAQDAFASGSPSNTRREIKTQDMEDLYRIIWEN